MNFTDETIKAELAVCEAATERPWEVIDGHIPQIEAVNKKRGVRPAGCPYPRIARMAAGYAPDERNAELVVHACNNYEAALKELLELRRVNAMLEAHVDEARSEQYAADENAAYLEEALKIRDMRALNARRPAPHISCSYSRCTLRWVKEGDTWKCKHSATCPTNTHPIGGKA